MGDHKAYTSRAPGETKIFWKLFWRKRNPMHVDGECFQVIVLSYQIGIVDENVAAPVLASYHPRSIQLIMVFCGTASANLEVSP